jgi:hypothetical protein
MSNENDLALAALLSAASEVGTELNLSLLKKSYEIQKKHQFDRDEFRETSMQELKNLIDSQIDSDV